MNNADFGSTEHRGCARTSEPQLELEESTVQSIERNAGAGAGAAARRGAREPGWTPDAAGPL